MTVGAAQYKDQTLALLLAEFANLNLVFFLIGDTYTPDDTHTLVSQVGSPGTAAQVAADTSDYIGFGVGGDGEPIDATGLAVLATAGNGVMDCNDADFGNPVTIPGVKYLGVAIRAGANLAPTDLFITQINLRTEDAADVSASAAQFLVQMSAVAGLLRVLKQV